MDPSLHSTRKVTARLEISSAQLAASLDSRLYDERLSERDIAVGCAKACHWGLASVIVRPEHLPAATSVLAGSKVGIATALGWNEDDSEPTHPMAMLDEAHALAAAGATELGVVASSRRLAADHGALFRETLDGLVTAMTPLGVRLRLIADTESLTYAQVRDACIGATDAYVWMVQGGSWRGRRAGLTEIQLMRSALPSDVLLKWTEPVRRVETMLLCIALGIDRFNADVDELMQSAIRSEWHGPLTIPQPGVDF